MASRWSRHCWARRTSVGALIPAAMWFHGNRVSEKKNFLLGDAKRSDGRLLDRVMAAKAVVLTAAAVAVILCGLIATRMAAEFVPNLNEGDFAIQALRIPGTSLSQSVQMQQQIERTLKINSRDRAHLRQNRMWYCL